MFRPNRLKDRLRTGQPCIGCWSFIGSSVVAELLAIAGYDFIGIDHEHAPNSLEGAVSQLQAIDATGAHSLMRVPSNDAVYIKRALDIGVEGIMVPMVSTASEAKAAVDACAYPPAGIRGVATGVTRATEYGMRTEYPTTYRERLLLVVQIETPTAVKNAEAIAAVEGVDAVFLGPSDLAASIGAIGQTDSPEVERMINDVAVRLGRTGMPLGTVTRPGWDCDRLIGGGFTLLFAGSDVGFLRQGAAGQLGPFRNKYVAS